MTPEMTLNRRLTQTGRRIRIVLMCRWGVRALVAASLACVVWLACARLRWLGEPEPSVFGALLPAAFAVGLAIGALRRFTPMDVARSADARAGARDRLATALELQAAGGAGVFQEPQLADASRAAGALDIRRLYPMRLTRETVALSVLALGLVGLLFAPSIPLFWSTKQKNEAEQVKRNALRVERIAKEAEKTAGEKALPETAKAAKAARKLAKEMKEARLSKKDALVKMNKVTKAMEEQHRKLALANAPRDKKSLEQAAADAKKSMDAMQAARQAEMGKQAAKKGDAKAGKQQEGADKKQSDAMKNAQDALRKFMDGLAKNDPQAQNDALQQLADQMQQGGLTGNEMKELAEQLRKLGEALKGTKLDKLSKQFDEIAKQLKQMHLTPEQIKRIIQSLRQAGGT